MTQINEKIKAQKSQQIPIAVFMGILIYTTYKIIATFPPAEMHWTDATIMLILEIWFWSVVSLLGLKKAGIMGLAMNLYSIMLDSRFTMEERFNMAMQSVQQWLGVLADISILITKNESEVKSKLDNEEELEIEIEESNETKSYIDQLIEKKEVEKDFIKKPIEKLD